MYVYVVPRRQRVKLNVKKRQYSGRRQKRLHDPATWSNASHIMLLRQRALARVFVRGVQRWPVFYSFEVSIRFCVKAYNSSMSYIIVAYNSSMSYILLWGGRERGAHVLQQTGHAKQRSSLRVLDVEERRREVQVRFRDVRRPERAAVADRLPSESVHVVAVADGSRSSGVREAPGFIGIEQRERVVQAASGGLI